MASLIIGMRIAFAMKPGESVDWVTSVLSGPLTRVKIVWLTFLASFSKRSCSL
jgi:hypothetical protein